MKTLRILIAEDDEILRRLLADFLSRKNCTVDEAGNGRAAENLARDRNHDLVITDYRMPGMSGVELVRNLRDRHHELPIIGMSSLDHREDFMRAGVTHFLQKPFDISILEEMIDTFTENSS